MIIFSAKNVNPRSLDTCLQIELYKAVVIIRIYWIMFQKTSQMSWMFSALIFKGHNTQYK